MTYIVDAAALVLLLIFGVVGYKKGFFMVVMHLAAYLLSFAASSALSPIVGDALYLRYLQPPIHNKIVEVFPADGKLYVDSIAELLRKVLPERLSGFAGLFDHLWTVA